MAWVYTEMFIKKNNTIINRENVKTINDFEINGAGLPEPPFLAGAVAFFLVRLRLLLLLLLLLTGL